MIEVLGRTALIFLAIVLLIGVFSALVIVFSAIVEVHRLLPVLGNGVQPIIQSVVKKYALPVWGADCCYSSPSTSEPAEERDQGGYWAILFSGTMLALTSAVTISVLGENIVERSVFPLLTMVGKANISEFIERTEILIVMVLIIGVFLK